MYITILLLISSLSPKFSSKLRGSKKETVHLKKEKIENKVKLTQRKNEIKKEKTNDREKIRNIIIRNDDFYYPIISFNEIKKNRNFLTFNIENKKEIFPTARGIVIFVGKEKDLPGYTLVIYHSSKFVSIYSNLEEVKLIKGDLVKNVFDEIGIASKSLIFCIKKVLDNEKLEDIDFKSLLKKRNK